METHLTAVLKAVVGVLCGYEAVALAFGRPPTVSAICGRRPPLIPVIVGGLLAHLILAVITNRKEVTIHVVTGS